MTVSHGQASIEHGFSINKDVLAPNMLEKTIIAQRLVCDGVASSLDEKKCLQDFVVTKSLLQSCKVASTKYKNFLKEQRLSNQCNELKEETCRRFKFRKREHSFMGKGCSEIRKRSG